MVVQMGNAGRLEATYRDGGARCKLGQRSRANSVVTVSKAALETVTKRNELDDSGVVPDLEAQQESPLLERAITHQSHSRIGAIFGKTPRTNE
eukprot:COSAG02_NODE_4297_length_5538_cov_3.544402_6_plen_93_part_00